MSGQDQPIHVGKISGVFGVKGWLKITSFTEPRDNIVCYRQWHLRKGAEQKVVAVVDGHDHGKGVIARIAGIDDRDQALLLMGWEIYIDYSQLPTPESGEYYWADLVGLAVKNIQGVEFGKVDSLMETGANDVLIVKGKRERAIPFLQGQTVKSIDLDSGIMIVDWDAEF